MWRTLRIKAVNEDEKMIDKEDIGLEIVKELKKKEEENQDDEKAEDLVVIPQWDRLWVHIRGRHSQ